MSEADAKSLANYIREVLHMADKKGLLYLYAGAVVSETCDRLNGEDKEFNRVLVEKYEEEILKRMN